MSQHFQFNWHSFPNLALASSHLLLAATRSNMESDCKLKFWTRTPASVVITIAQFLFKFGGDWTGAMAPKSLVVEGVTYVPSMPQTDITAGQSTNNSLATEASKNAGKGGGKRPKGGKVDKGGAGTKGGKRWQGQSWKL